MVRWKAVGHNCSYRTRAFLIWYESAGAARFQNVRLSTRAGQDGMESLPDDVVRHVLGALGTREQVCLSTLSRRMRDAYAALPAVRGVTVTFKKLDGGMHHWLRSNARRLQRVTTRRAVPTEEWLRGAEALRCLRCFYGRVPVSVLAALPDPGALRELVLHQLEPSGGTALMHTLSRFGGLRALAIAFSRRWGAVHVGCLGACADLRRLELRRAKTLTLSGSFPPHLEELTLGARDALECGAPLPATVQRVVLDVADGPLPRGMFRGAAYPAMTSLRVVATGMLRMRCLRKMPGLERLYVYTQSCILCPEMFQAAASLELHVDYCFACGCLPACVAGQLAAIPRVRATCAGKRFDLTRFIM